MAARPEEMRRENRARLAESFEALDHDSLVDVPARHRLPRGGRIAAGERLTSYPDFAQRRLERHRRILLSDPRHAEAVSPTT